MNANERKYKTTKDNITETHEKDTLYSRLSVAWMLQTSLHGGIYGAS